MTRIATCCISGCFVSVVLLIGATEAWSTDIEWKSRNDWRRCYIDDVLKYSFNAKSGTVKQYDVKSKKWTTLTPLKTPRTVSDKMKDYGLIPLMDSPSSKGWRRAWIDGTYWSFHETTGKVKRRTKSSSGKYRFETVSSDRIPPVLRTAMCMVGAGENRASAQARTSGSSPVFAPDVVQRHRVIGGESPATTLNFLKEKCNRRYVYRTRTGKDDLYASQSISYRDGELIIRTTGYGQPPEAFYVPLNRMNPTNIEYDYTPDSRRLIQKGGLFAKEKWECNSGYHSLRLNPLKDEPVIRRIQGTKNSPRSMSS
ncbi:hypothetical protein GC176_26560 [bacterium]|nr:hypothetical protein [bacterium]